MKNQNKIALITGGSRGLGKDMALQLARNGADIVLTYNSRQEGAEAVAKEIEQLGRKTAVFPLDTGDIRRFGKFRDQLAAVLKEKWKRDNFDFLINNAGIGIKAPFEKFTEAQFDSLVKINFKGVYFLTQTLLPQLADGGRIVLLSSGLARFSIPGFSVYGPLKAALDSLARYLAKELGTRQITANVVAPGAIETDFTKKEFEAHPEMKQFIASQTALGRVGKADDIGGVVTFLCSEEARWVNGQRIEASGGIGL